jgi:hypothetical protein
VAYTINYFKQSRLEWADDPWRGTLEDAQATAENAVASGTAERVEVRNEHGDLVFHYPRTTRRA